MQTPPALISTRALRLFRCAYISQSKVAALVESIEDREEERRRCKKEGRRNPEHAGKELQAVEHATAEHTEKTAHRLNSNILQPRFAEEMFEAIPRVAVVVMRLLVLFPLVGCYHKQAAGRR